MKKEYLRTYKIVNIVIVCLVIYIYFFPQISIVLEKVMPNSTKCVYLTITGKPCPLCGGTRYIKNIKNCFYDITYLYNFFGVIVIGAFGEFIFRIINLYKIKKEKISINLIKYDICIHAFFIFLFFLYEIIYIIVN